MNKKYKNLKEVKILKNKEIIIFINGKKYKHFKKKDSKSLKPNEMYILEYLLNKYMDYEVDSETQRSDNTEENVTEYEPNEEYSQSNITNKKSNKIYKQDEDDDDDRIESSVYKSKKIKRCIRSQNKNKSVTKISQGEVVEIKDFKGKNKVTKNKYLPQKFTDNENSESYYTEEREEISSENYKKSQKDEYIPQYIIQLESYTSPTIKKINEQKAEETVLNGLNLSLFINGNEKKGILFLAKNNILCFVPFGGGNETDIILDNIKKIYFNVNGSANLNNYEKTNEEKFIKIIEKNDKTTYLKFNNEEEYEYFIKGLLVTFNKKTSGVDKNLIYQIIKSTLRNNNDNNNNSKNFIYKKNKNKNINENGNIVKNNNYYQKENNNSKEEEIDNDEENNEATNKNNENDDDIIITTTITEVFKDGELINKQTKEKMDGIVKSLHVYSPDMDEYEKFLNTTKLGKNQLKNRIKEGLQTKNVENENKQDQDLKNNNERNPIKINYHK